MSTPKVKEPEYAYRRLRGTAGEESESATEKDTSDHLPSPSKSTIVLVVKSTKEGTAQRVSTPPNQGYEDIETDDDDGHDNDNHRQSLDAASEHDGFLSGVRWKKYMTYRDRFSRFGRYFKAPLVLFPISIALLAIIVVIGTIALVKIKNNCGPVRTFFPYMPRTYDRCDDWGEGGISPRCDFDPFAFAYIPRVCHDDELMNAALDPYPGFTAPVPGKPGVSAPSHPWALDSNFTTLVPQTAAGMSEHEYLWTTAGMYKAICLYEWRYMARVMESLPMTSHIIYVWKQAASVARVERCTALLMDHTIADETPVRMRREFGECVLLRAPGVEVGTGEGKKYL
ncbi:hypothetical protein MMC25_001500 [Agyrium rufum]|nr:hypothetical protein [Agyrium rufum]